MNQNIKKCTAVFLAAAALSASSGCGMIVKNPTDPIVYPETKDQPSVVSSADSETDKQSDSVDASSAAVSSKAAESKAAKSDDDNKKTSSSKASSKMESKAASRAESKSESTQKPESILLSETSFTLFVGNEKYITATVMPVGDEIVWTSSNESVAVVDKNGRVAALKAGECTITAAAKSDKNVKASASVKVSDPSASSHVQTTSTSAPQNNQTTTSENTAATASSTEQENVSSTTGSKVSDISMSFTNTVLYVGQTVTPNITLTPSDPDDSAVTLTTSDDTVAYINDDGSVTAAGEGACTITATPHGNREISDSVILTVTTPQDSDSDEENENGESDDPQYEYPRQELYIDDILIVNKTYFLPRSYNPGGLTAECANAFEALRQGAAADGIDIWLASGFRSYDYQADLYYGYVSYYGQYTADTFSARPGHSEHQTGLAIDCNIINDSFIGTPEAIWLENHCHEYGFIIRYPYGKQDVTGYKYEPWHIRYIGDMATEIYESGLTLEEYYGLTSEYDY